MWAFPSIEKVSPFCKRFSLRLYPITPILLEHDREPQSEYVWARFRILVFKKLHFASMTFTSLIHARRRHRKNDEIKRIFGNLFLFCVITFQTEFNLFINFLHKSFFFFNFKRLSIHTLIMFFFSLLFSNLSFVEIIYLQKERSEKHRKKGRRTERILDEIS